MKQQKTFSLVAFALLQAALLLSACSSEENIPASGGIAVTDAHINISVAPFETSSGKAKTRAEGTDETKADTVLLANGMRAICTVEEDDEAEQTRAPKPIADGHYTIYACDPVTGNRITGPDKLLKGTVTGGVFQSDGGTRLFLDPGTYKFVCFNDAVEDNGTYLSISTGIYGGSPTTYIPSAGDAQIGTATETISGDNWQVNFTMHHQNTRIRMHIIAYSDHMDNAWGCVYGGNKEQPMFQRYAVDGTYSSNGTTPPYGYVLSHFKMPATSTDYNATYVRAHDFYSDYMYLTPGIDVVAGDIGCVGNSRLYGKQIPGNGSQKKVNALQNHSYTVTYRILPNALYLFEDGSCGALAEKGSRTPIGMVVTEKTATDQGTACALDILNYTWKNVDDHIEENISPSPKNMAEAAADMNGENWTYKANLQGTVRSNQATTYPAFYQAAHYTPSVSTSGIGRWYLPSYGELIKFVQVFQEGFTPTATESVAPHYDQMYTGFETKVRNAFTQASKPDIGSQFIISSTQIYGGTPSLGFRPTYINIWSGDQLYTGFCWNTMINGYIMPFVHF